MIFQLLLWALLFGPSLLSFAGPAVAAVGWLSGVGVLTFYIVRRPSSEKHVAAVVAAVHAGLSLLFVLAFFKWFNFSTALFWTIIGYTLLYLWLKKVRPFCEGVVLGFDQGYAIVRIVPSVVPWAAPGEYAVATQKPVKKGQKVKVLFGSFSKKGKVV